MWVRLDDAILDNPKIIAAGPLGFALHVAAITWCGRNLTDGMIPKRRVSQLLDLPSLQVSETTKVRVLHALTADDLAADLVQIGLWHDRGDRYELHDYLVYNLSKAQVLARRETERNRLRMKRCDPVATNTEPSCAHPVPGPDPDPDPNERKPSLRSGKRKWTRVPAGEALTPARLEMGRTHGGLLPSAIRAEWGAFCDHEFQAPKIDVDATWRNWLRRAKTFHRNAAVAQ